MATPEAGEALNASFFYIELTGLTTAAFRELSGIGSEHDVIIQHQTNSQGKSTYVKTAGKMTWQNIVLKKGVDTDMNLWGWRNQIITEGVNGQKKDGQIYICDVQGNQLTTWKIVGAWPCNYSIGALVPDTNEMLIEEIHLAHEGLERVK
jgi:phage tail-like protein